MISSNLGHSGGGGFEEICYKKENLRRKSFLGNAEWSSNVMKLFFNVDWINQWYLCKNEASHHSIYFKKFWKMICDDGKTNA